MKTYPNTGAIHIYVCVYIGYLAGLETCIYTTFTFTLSHTHVLHKKRIPGLIIGRAVTVQHTIIHVSLNVFCIYLFCRLFYFRHSVTLKQVRVRWDVTDCKGFTLVNMHSVCISKTGGRVICPCK